MHLPSESNTVSSRQPIPPHANPYFHQLANEVTTLAAHINAAQCEWLLLVAEFDRVEAWKMDCGSSSTAEWLSWKCRLGKGTAREKVRVARALVELTEIRDAFAAGELSYSIVRELTRVATPAREAALLNVCRHGTASHVERLVRHVRRIDREANPESSFDAWDQRRASWWEREDGMIEIRVVLAPDQGRTVTAALDTLTANVREEAESENEGIDELSHKSHAESPIAQHRADAVERLAELALVADTNTETKLTGGDLNTINLNINADQPIGDNAGDVPAGTPGRLSCDCAVVASIRDSSGNTLSVGRKHEPCRCHCVGRWNGATWAVPFRAAPIIDTSTLTTSFTGREVAKLPSIISPCFADATIASSTKAGLR